MCDLVSILIPTYNRQDFIAETLESALSQTYSNIEVIVCDNASSDRTPEIVQGYVAKDSRVKFYRNDANLGPVLNWEECLKRATGEYTHILWSDDLIEPLFLEKTLALFQQKTDLAFVFSKVKLGPTPENLTHICYDSFKKTGIYPSVEFVKGFLTKRDLPYSPACAVFKTKILKQSFVKENEFFENRYLENGAGPDLLMFLLATTQASYFGYCELPLSYFRAHPKSITVSSNFTQLMYDYRKAIFWFFERSYGRKIAIKYWCYVFRERRLYSRKRRSFAFYFMPRSSVISFFELFKAYILGGYFIFSKAELLRLLLKSIR